MGDKGPLELSIVLYMFTGIMVGFAGRWWMLRGDIRQNPTYPNGYLIHLTTGFIAAAMGAIAYPALLDKNYVAVTFLALAIQQFREVRKIEKESLLEMDREAYFPRGTSYIDGIAKTFEARNYIVMISAFVTTVMAFIVRLYIENKFMVIGISAITGILVIYLMRNYTRGHNIQDIASIETAPLVFKEGCNLFVGEIYVMNVGLTATRDRILKNGIGLIIKPHGNTEKIILNHQGQQTAILHQCAQVVGLERYAVSRRDFDTGEVGIMLVPIEKDVNYIIELIKRVPILETLKKDQTQINKSEG